MHTSTSLLWMWHIQRKSRMSVVCVCLTPLPFVNTQRVPQCCCALRYRLTPAQEQLRLIDASMRAPLMLANVTKNLDVLNFG